MKDSGQDATLNMSYSEIIGPGHTLEDPSFTSGEPGVTSILAMQNAFLISGIGLVNTWRVLPCVVNVLVVSVSRMLKTDKADDRHRPA